MDEGENGFISIDMKSSKENTLNPTYVLRSLYKDMSQISSRSHLLEYLTVFV